MTEKQHHESTREPKPNDLPPQEENIKSIKTQMWAS